MATINKPIPLLCWLDHEVEVEVNVDYNSGNTAKIVECQTCGYMGYDSTRP